VVHLRTLFAFGRGSGIRVDGGPELLAFLRFLGGVQLAIQPANLDGGGVALVLGEVSIVVGFVEVAAAERLAGLLLASALSLLASFLLGTQAFVNYYALAAALLLFAALVLARRDEVRG